MKQKFLGSIGSFLLVQLHCNPTGLSNKRTHQNRHMDWYLDNLKLNKQEVVGIFFLPASSNLIILLIHLYSTFFFILIRMAFVRMTHIRPKPLIMKLHEMIYGHVTE
jgi:hypothetical protein